jgi:hypothetical protein
MSKLFDEAAAVAVMAERGPMSIRAWAAECVGRGIFTVEHNDGAILASARQRLSELARSQDVAGLPRMGRTGQSDDVGSPLWAERDLWDVAAYEINILGRLDQSDAIRDVAVALARECRQRYHCVPSDARLEGLLYDDAAESEPAA